MATIRGVPNPVTENLRDVLRRNRDRYNRQLQGSDAAGWDYCVLTASNLQQARGYKLELERRRRAGWLPLSTLYLVVPDLRERRIGSGGAAAYALRRVMEDRVARQLPATDLRLLILNSGGNSRRLPHCATFGKAFADLNFPLFPGGPASTVFDELMVSACGLPEQIQSSTVILSGDVLLGFAPEQFQPGAGVTALACPAPWERAAEHGVFVSDPEGGPVRDYLHHPAREELEAAGALIGEQVLLDTGLLAFDEEATRRLGALSGITWTEDGPQFAVGLLERPEAANLQLDLYTEIGQALLGRGTPESRGTPAGRQVNQLLTRTFHGLGFAVSVARPGSLVHLSSTRDWMDFCTGERLEARAYAPQWRALPTRALGSQVTNGHATPASVCVLSSRIAKLTGTGPSMLEYCHLPWCEVRERTLLSGVHAGQGLSLPAGLVLNQIPLRPSSSQPARHVAQLYGVDDDPQELLVEGRATFQGKPLADWMESRGLSPDTLWPHLDADVRCLWNARLFVPGDEENTLRWARWLYAPAGRDEVFQWMTLERVSFEECARLADQEAVFKYRAQLRAEALAEDLVGLAFGDLQPRALFSSLGSVVEMAEVTAAFLDQLDHYEPFERMRAYQVLSDLLGDGRLQRIAAAETNRPDGELPPEVEDLLYHFFHRRMRSSFEAASFLEELAFDEVGAALASALAEHPSTRRRILAPGARAMVCAPARIDFGGGWTDIPPFSLEHGGTVLNAAVLLNGERPIIARGEILAEPVLELISVDGDAREIIVDATSLSHYQHPADPLALHKAAAVLAGFAGPGPNADLTDYLRRLGGGLRLITDLKLPSGSGLGGSSIAAMALLRCLDLLQGRESTPTDLSARVLYLGQMLTTGGGWQDQLGGIYPGVKLLETRPGLGQEPEITPVNLSPQVAGQLDQQLLLCYVGERRISKNLVRQIMRRYLARAPEVMRVLQDIKIITRDMREALEAGALDAVGRLMAQHWELTKQMDRQMTTPHVERLLGAMNGLAYGAKLAGAGGGGFMMIMAREGAAQKLRERLGPILASRGGRFYDVKIDEQGPESKLDNRTSEKPPDDDVEIQFLP
jgi:fucokinase